jgi:hypothetical protein
MGAVGSEVVVVRSNSHRTRIGVEIGNCDKEVPPCEYSWQGEPVIATTYAYDSCAVAVRVDDDTRKVGRNAILSKAIPNAYYGGYDEW